MIHTFADEETRQVFQGAGPGVELGGIHPGEVLREDFLLPMRLSAYRLAQGLGVPQTRIAEIVQGRRAITADTAHRLARFFGTSAQLWLNLQAQYDLERAEAQNRDAYEQIAAHEQIAA